MNVFIALTSFFFKKKNIRYKIKIKQLNSRKALKHVSSIFFYFIYQLQYIPQHDLIHISQNYYIKAF